MWFKATPAGICAWIALRKLSTLTASSLRRSVGSATSAVAVADMTSENLTPSLSCSPSTSGGMGVGGDGGAGGGVLSGKFGR
jgi:hypothetical protein